MAAVGAGVSAGTNAAMSRGQWGARVSRAGFGLSSSLEVNDESGESFSELDSSLYTPSSSISFRYQSLVNLASCRFWDQSAVRSSGTAGRTIEKDMLLESIFKGAARAETVADDMRRPR